MSPSNTRPRHARKDTHHSSSSRTPASRPPFAFFFPGVLTSRMPSVFNIARACIYAAVCVWTVICLGIAVHFHGILVSSNLTRFIPFAIFACCASLLLILALLGFGFWRDRNPISTRTELFCLGLAGALWLALGIVLVSSEADGADVECFSANDPSQLLDMSGFNTETYHAQYRVMEACSFFNIILLWTVISVLLFMTIRHYRWGNRTVLISSVTAFPWFSKPGSRSGKQLPPPVTAQRSRSHRSHRSQTRAKEAPPVPEKAPMPPRRLPSGRSKPTHNEEPQHVFWMPHSTPPQPAHLSESRRVRDRYYRDASPRR
ncbi:hypothetical protein BXZ70DRAFT_335313 [Cristinia sonorae]|uniref:MARVEL domain-containing protein n=1 Tax=Cristinia sonorae TaxID=1940300 RepID=A0A8K0UKD7_9AGAR|nr:hypothetical protein BXZ70DRAFT_335313 [Cristinia sonorae]